MLEKIEQFSGSSLNAASDGFRSPTRLSRALAKMRSLGPLFGLTVALPTAIATVYFGFLASDVYISESRFVVRSPEKAAPTGLGVLLKGVGFSNAGDEIYAAQDFVTSRDALRQLNRGKAFENAYRDPHISVFNRFAPFGMGSTFEELYKYYGKHVGVERDSTSSITKLTVRAYSADTARKFNEQLLEMAEGTVNRLNERGRNDLIRFAQAEVNDAKDKSRHAASALAAYRNRQGVVDPEKQAAVQMQMISKLQDELIGARTQLVALRAFTPRNPQIPVLESRTEELSREIDQEMGKVAGSQKSLAATAVEFQRLSLENQFADKQLAAAMASLEDAQNEARRKQAYVERIVQPNLPDDALEPRRVRGILATLAMGLIVWGILSMMSAGVREHRD